MGLWEHVGKDGNWYKPLKGNLVTYAENFKIIHAQVGGAGCGHGNCTFDSILLEPKIGLKNKVY